MKKRARQSRKPKIVVTTRQAEINTVAAHLRSLMAAGLTQEEHEDLIDALDLGPRDIVELEERIDKAFHPMVGPAAAFFELPMGNGEVFRVTYSTLRFWLPEQGANSVRKLCNQAWKVLEEIALNAKHTPTLFWRIKPTISESFGRTTIRMRLSIPGTDLLVHASPEGGEEPML